MALTKGDFILINYTAKVKETNEVFDTTFEETAKTAHLQKEGELYEPKLVVIGEGWVLKSLDESFPNMEIDKESQVEIPPEKAFGPRDSEKVKRVHLRQILEKGINPAVGMRIEFGGKNATIRSIGAGRVLLDFNPPLAGRTLVYDIKINKKIETNDEKIAALIHRRIPVTEIEKFKTIVENNILTIEMPEDTYYLEGVQIAKRGISMDIQKFFPDFTATKFIEIYQAPPKPSTESKPEAAEEEQTTTEAENKVEEKTT